MRENPADDISMGGGIFIFFCGWSLCVGLGAEMQGNDGGLQFIRVVSSTRYQDETKARVLGPRASPLIGQQPQAAARPYFYFVSRLF